MEEQLRQELLRAVMRMLGEEASNKLDMAFTLILHKYNVESKQTELAIYDDSNMKIVKNYIASLRLEGKSEKTIDQYYRIVCNFLKAIGKPIKKILTGDIRYYLARYLTDRKEAIKYAIEHGEPGDIIVLAGKGHEDYQEIKGVKYPMDERVLIKEVLEELKGN